MNVNEIAADRLDELQAEKNDGRGVSCVRVIVSELRRNDKASAATVANTDWDKIRSYPDIARYLKVIGLVKADAYVLKD